MGVENLLEGNRDWAKRTTTEDPSFFKRLADQQAPPYLWIGCSDSRVPANQITNLLPGEIFVHRNIANQVFEGDVNLSAVVQFALQSLKVKQIIICGHYGCAGVEAALGIRKIEGLSVVDTWLNGLKSLVSEHQNELGQIKDQKSRADRMAELNVHNQVRKLNSLEIIKQARREGHNFEVHGLIYRIQDGLLHLVP